MVLGVCRRYLPHRHDAEDAFQATFLVLLGKARSIRKPGSLASWLYGVARRTALRAKTNAALRRNLERQAGSMPSRKPNNHHFGHDLRSILDEELERLPETHRAVLVLCGLEEKTIAAAAGQLGWPRGTVAGRLARARERLRGRLARRGILISTAALAELCSGKATAALPPPLMEAMLQSAWQLVSGNAAEISASALGLANTVLKSLACSKIKVTAAVLMVSGLLIGNGIFRTGQSSDPAAEPSFAVASPFAPRESVKEPPVCEPSHSAPSLDDPGEPDQSPDIADDKSYDRRTEPPVLAWLDISQPPLMLVASKVLVNEIVVYDALLIWDGKKFCRVEDRDKAKHLWQLFYLPDPKSAIGP